MELASVASGLLDQRTADVDDQHDDGLPIQLAVHKAISVMRARYFDPISLTQLAAEVYVSPFHFTRIFAKAVGVTPGRYLTALRLFEAKRLLLTTSLTVSDIVCGVGYSSVGTFTSRFTRAVGMTPTQYREPEVGELLVAIAPNYGRAPTISRLAESGRACSAVRPGGGVMSGHVELPPDAAAEDILIGVFGDSVPQSGPIAFTGLSSCRSGDFVIQGVPHGRWTMIAVAGRGDHGRYSVATAHGSMTSVAGAPTQVNLRLRAIRSIDPPIAITLAPLPSRTGGRTTVAHRSGPRRAA